MMYHLYFYKKVYQRLDFIYIPNIYKQSIYISQRLKKLLPYDMTLDEFVKMFLGNDAVYFYKNREKTVFSFYVSHKDTIFKVEGRKMGRNGCVLQLYNVDKMKETADYWSNLCQSLKKQVSYLEYILDHAPLLVCGKDLEGKIKYCNRFYAQHLDKTQTEVLKEQITLITQNPIQYIPLRGQRRFFEIQNFTTEEDHIEIGIDKTDYDMVKREFDHYLSATHNIFEQLSTPIAVFNADQGLTFFNKAYQILFDFDVRFLGAQPSIGEILDDLRKRQKIPEPADFMNYKNMHKSFFNNLLEPLEETLHLPNGKVLRSVVTPQPSGGVLYMYEDITHPIQLEKDHKSLNAAQKEILNHLHEGIVIFGSDHRLRFVNPMFQTMFQAKKSMSHVTDMIQFVESSLLTRQMILELFEKRVYDSGGLTQTISWSYTPLPDGSHLLSFFNMSPFQKSA